ncbi:hypothetical protein TVAG_030150 [Trichomonas vaginalis G3]|uniref:DUF3447 domain-containing protein n=1 Tax=Trichomonas vaginalis (strain ATCC PRA-98 / G3) TaxID=412133 RepID=A2FVE2_TRIV3|nr:spectrin binding [Trichomonas vaginalis G3]EAX91116.1 hypothetical protein TVAG_030150 [Trichomonas vaginalis G3]KAI5519347.1 spectrin binding [Trichomonas vaginalis G3]|eukprot:XP_001304046.1 hypothetical protein [Trichomonas vaginalis G3]
MEKSISIELKQLCKGQNDVFDTLFRLKTSNNDDINQIFEELKSQYIEAKRISPHKIIETIFTAAKYNNRYTKSYWELFKKVYNEYHPTQTIMIDLAFDYFVHKEYGIFLYKDHKESIEEYYQFQSNNYSLNVHEEGTIFRAIMEDNKDSLISFTEKNDFDAEERIENPFYPDPYHLYSLLELCCYHGSVVCFKFLRTKFNLEITPICLQYSFLSGNTHIISECLKVQKPSKECMKYAIISHEIEKVIFLMNDYETKIKLDDCVEYNNLLAFLAYFDQNKSIDDCFAVSPSFGLKSICKYLLDHGADINAKDSHMKTALHYAAEYNNAVIAELLISRGADIESTDSRANTSLIWASQYNSKEVVEILLSHGATITKSTALQSSPLITAASYNSKETAEVLISHGADVNEADDGQKTPLHWAAMCESPETAELLISHGADINLLAQGIPPIQYAADQGSIGMVKVLVSHGADVNFTEDDGFTPLQAAIYRNNKAMVDVLISLGAQVTDDINKSLENMNDYDYD